jgi:hypothetical protein
MKLVKQTRLALFLAIVMSSAFVACKKDKKDDATPSLSMVLKADGAEVKTGTVKGVLLNQMGVAMLTATGTIDGNTAGWSVTVTFPNGEVKPGTYSGDAASINFSGGVGTNALSSMFEGGSATVTLSKVDDHNAEGTFSGTVVNTNDPDVKKVITEGKFSVKY